jgi:hypothetical protein
LGLGSGSGSLSGFGFGSGFGLEMAPRVPLGMEVLGSLRLEARLAPERMPVKQGKKSERHLVRVGARARARVRVGARARVRARARVGFGARAGARARSGVIGFVCALGESIRARIMRTPVLGQVVRDVAHARGAREAFRGGEAASPLEERLGRTLSIAAVTAAAAAAAAAAAVGQVDAVHRVQVGRAQQRDVEAKEGEQRHTWLGLGLGLGLALALGLGLGSGSGLG